MVAVLIGISILGKIRTRFAFAVPNPKSAAVFGASLSSAGEVCIDLCGMIDRSVGLSRIDMVCIEGSRMGSSWIRGVATILGLNVE